MANLYSDIALKQLQGVNFPGQTGQLSGMTVLPNTQNNPLLETAPDLIATYTLTGNEAAGDIINWGILNEGVIGNPGGRICTGPVAPAATLTVNVGDNDLGSFANLPIVNAATFGAQPAGYVAPTWVTGTVYVAGNVVIDAASTPANQTYINILGLTSATAPHSDATHWLPCAQRYSTSLNVAGASANVTFTGGIQLYGGPAYAPTTGVVPLGYTANELANSQYQIQHDCWLQSVILTVGTPVAGTVLICRMPVYASN